MRETATEADHESDDARREGARVWRGGSVAAAEWDEAMAGSVGDGRERKWGVLPETGGRSSYPVYPGRLARQLKVSAATEVIFLREISVWNTLLIPLA